VGLLELMSAHSAMAPAEGQPSASSSGPAPRERRTGTSWVRVDAGQILRSPDGAHALSSRTAGAESERSDGGSLPWSEQGTPGADTSRPGPRLAGGCLPASTGWECGATWRRQILKADPRRRRSRRRLPPTRRRRSARPPSPPGSVEEGGCLRRLAGRILGAGVPRGSEPGAGWRAGGGEELHESLGLQRAGFGRVGLPLRPGSRTRPGKVNRRGGTGAGAPHTRRSC